MSGHAAPASARPRKVPTLRTIAVVLLAAALTAAGTTAWHWRTHPDAFPTPANGWGSGDFPAGKTHYVSVVSGLEDVERVRIERVTPVFERNTARADVHFLVCTIDPASGVGGVGLVGRRSFERTCPDPVPAEGAWFEPSPSEHQDVVMAVTPRTDGAVRISAVQITYTQGWQRGTQLTGPSYEAPHTLP